MLFEELSAAVEQQLGIRMDPQDRSSVQHLNAIPAGLVKNARKLEGVYLPLSYLEFYVVESDHRYLRRFLKEVVQDGMDPRTWVKGQTLTPDVSLHDQLTKTKEQIFGDLLQGTVSMTPPDYQAWSYNDAVPGGFAFAQPNADYRSKAPEGFIFSRNAILQPVDREQIPVLFRRWIASRIAMVMRDQLQQLPDVSPLEQFADQSLWTEDARKAIRGLTLEKEQGLWKSNLWGKKKVPGYCGPDAFYA